MQYGCGESEVADNASQIGRTRQPNSANAEDDYRDLVNALCHIKRIMSVQLSICREVGKNFVYVRGKNQDRNGNQRKAQPSHVASTPEYV